MHQHPPSALPLKRLIEVDFPVARVSEHARREKSRRLGGMSRLHVWWARKPLASCRAVTCAALWPDPADPACPEEFRREARAVVEAWLRDGGREAFLSREGERLHARLVKSPKTLDDPVRLRQALLEFVAEFSAPENASRREFVEPARALTRIAWQALAPGRDGGDADRFLVVDPFAGGGSISLESLRIGTRARAADLNPVAVILERVLLEYLPRHGEQLVEEVRRWGRWMARKIRADLARYFPPDPDGSIPVAWLWSRTVRCEACNVEVPTRYSPWLANNRTRSLALRLVPRPDRSGVDCEFVESPRPSKVGEGTVSFSRVTCPCCGHVTPGRAVRQQLQARHGGTDDARLIAVVTRHPSQRGRRYRLATPADLEAIEAARRAVEALAPSGPDGLSPLPDEPSPIGGVKGAGRAFAQRNHGLDRFRDFFTARQALVLDAMVRAIRSVGDHLQHAPEIPAEIATAVQTVLTLVLNRQADYGNSLNRWDPGSENSKQLFARQTMAVVWDFAETNAIDEETGTLWRGLARVEDALECLRGDWEEGEARLESATAQALASGAADLVFTDPPHYDNVPYADLSDFFYVWMKRAIGPLHPDLLSADLSPKGEEALLDPDRGKDHAFFQDVLGRSLGECRRVLAANGVFVVIFAHKTSGAWEGQLQALLDAGWMVTAAWPITTELTTRLRAHDSAVLTSTLHLVCRPRHPQGADATPSVGSWDAVCDEILRRFQDWFPKMDKEKVKGEDSVFACLGPALEVYSRYDRIDREDGRPVSVRELLEHLWEVISGEDEA